jgi:hypothetical protein
VKRFYLAFDKSYPRNGGIFKLSHFSNMCFEKGKGSRVKTVREGRGWYPPPLVQRLEKRSPVTRGVGHQNIAYDWGPVVGIQKKKFACDAKENEDDQGVGRWTSPVVGQGGGGQF